MMVAIENRNYKGLSNHSVGSLMDRAPPGLKTDKDNLIKDNLDCYCRQRNGKGKEERWCYENAELSSVKVAGNH